MEVHEKNLDCVSLSGEHGQEVGAIYFVPCDFGIAPRVNELTQLFPALVEAVRPLHLRTDGTTSREDADKLHEAERRLCETLDYVCGVATSQEVFRTYRPFATIGGSFWATTVIRALASIMPRLSARMEYLSRTTWAGNKKNQGGN